VSISPKSFASMRGITMIHEAAPLAPSRFPRNPRSLSPRQIALLPTFAEQAVIAVENVRLFTELQEKNRASLTAHAQVFRGAGAADGDGGNLRLSAGRRPTCSRSSTRSSERRALCGGLFSRALSIRRELIQPGRQQNFTPEALEEGVVYTRRAQSRARDRAGDPRGARCPHNRRRAPDPNISHEPCPGPIAFAAASGYHAAEGAPIGVIMWRAPTLGRSPTARSAPEDLRDQAVIAIENVRLSRSSRRGRAS